MIQSVSRAIDILQAVAGKDDWVGVREIARTVGLKVPTTQQLLKTLMARNFLEFNEELRQYRTGLGLWLIAEKINPVNRLANKIKPYIDGLFSEFGETTVALALFNNDVKVIDWRQSRQSLAVIAPDEGVIRVPHQLAGGRIVLAFSDQTFRENYLKTIRFPEKGKNLFKNKTAFLTEIQNIRKQKYAFTENVINSGIGAIAVPVFAETGDFSISLSCSMPLNRFTKGRKNQILKSLKKASDQITTTKC